LGWVEGRVSGCPGAEDILPDVDNELGIKDCSIGFILTGVVNMVSPGDSYSAVEQLIPTNLALVDV